jgi:arylsulfatase A-like enzyme
LRESNQYENTLIVFTSDHGDCQGAHGWSQKTVLFDESSRVPFIIVPPGAKKAGTSSLLVNTGIDLLPTLCEYAGIEIPSRLPGMSLKATAYGRAATSARPYIVVENKMVQGVPIDGNKPEPNGRMVRSHRFKYCAYDMGEQRESLVDMENDPGEMLNLADKKEYRQTLEQHRRYLAEWCQKTRDLFVVPGKP